MKGNYKIFALSLLVLVTGCGNINSSSVVDSSSINNSLGEISTSEDVVNQTNVQKALSKLKDGYSANQTITKNVSISGQYTSSKETYKNYFDYQTNTEKYTFQGYKESDKEPTRDTLIDSGEITSNEGKAAYANLGINNKIAYTNVILPANMSHGIGALTGGETMSFASSTFANPLYQLYDFDFAQEENNSSVYRCVVKDEDTTKFTKFGFGLLGTVDYTLKTFSVTLNSENDIVSYDATFVEFSEDSNSKTAMSLNGVIASTGKNVEVKPTKTFETNTQGTALTEAIKKIGNNYSQTINVYSPVNGVETKTLSFDSIVTENTLSYESYNYLYPMNYNITYSQDGEMLKQYTRIGEKYYPYLTPTKENLSDMLPKFDISADVFDFDSTQNVYKLKKIVPSISPSSAVYNVFSTFNISDLSIKVEDDKITFMNEGEDFKEETILTKIGSTQALFASEKIENDTSNLTWKDLLSNQPDEYNNYLAYMKSDDIINAIPTLGGNYTLATIAVDDKYREIMYHLGSYSEELINDLNVYLNDFINQGWDTPTPNLYGGFTSSCLYQLETDGGVKVLPYVDIFIYSLSNGEVVMYIYAYIN